MIIQFLTGSTVYGTANENSDRDIIQVYIPSAHDTILGKIKNTHKVADEDVTRYPLAEFVKMIANGNPNVFPYLFTPDQYIEEEDDIVLWIRRNPEWFVSQKAARAMIGMAYSQLNDAQDGVTGKMGAKRKALVEKFGYDTKMVSNAVRVAAMARELIFSYRVEVDRRDIDANWLKSFKSGAFSLAQARLVVSEMDTEVNNNIGNLPPEPRYYFLYPAIVDTTTKYWRHYTYEV